MIRTSHLETIPEMVLEACWARVDRLYRGTSLIRNSTPLGPYSKTVPRALRWSYEGGLSLMSEVPLQPPETGPWPKTLKNLGEP